MKEHREYIIFGIVVCMIIILGVIILINQNRRTLYNLEDIKADSYVRNNTIKLMKEYDSYNAIKAMVIVVRTGYYKGIAKQNDIGEVNCLEYINKMCGDGVDKMESYSKEYIDRVDTAIKDTKGEVLTYKDEIIYPFFHFTSSGETVNEIKNKIIPYLKNKKCSYDVESPDYMQVKEYSKGEWRRILVDILGKDAKVQGDICIAERDKCKEVEKAVIDNKYSIDGITLKNKLGLNSLNYSVRTNNENVIFTSLGKGSGMGISIYSAYRMSKDNKDYRQIINSFYKDVKIKKIYN